MDTNTTENNPINEHNKTLLNWKAPEFISHAKSGRWFVIAGIVVAMLIAYAIYTRSASMAIVFTMLAGVYYLTHNQQPKVIDIKITQLGIFVDKTFYPYNMINSFWIIYHPLLIHTLNLKLGDKTSTKVVIQLDSQNPVKVRKFLAKEIPEIEGKEESFLDLFTKILRL